jgi:hypothetical protein
VLVIPINVDLLLSPNVAVTNIPAIKNVNSLSSLHLSVKETSIDVVGTSNEYSSYREVDIE